jgi:hypothetical protein
MVIKMFIKIFGKIGKDYPCSMYGGKCYLCFSIKGPLYRKRGEIVKKNFWENLGNIYNYGCIIILCSNIYRI